MQGVQNALSFSHSAGSSRVCRVAVPFSSSGAPLPRARSQFTTNQATVAVAGDAGALFRNTVNLLLAGSGTAALTATPPATFCIRARTRLAALSAAAGTTADFDPEGMTTVPLRENAAGPETSRAIPPERFSAMTPIPEEIAQVPCTPETGPTPTMPSPLTLSPLTPLELMLEPNTPEPLVLPPPTPAPPWLCPLTPLPVEELVPITPVELVLVPITPLPWTLSPLTPGPPPVFWHLVPGLSVPPDLPCTPIPVGLLPNIAVPVVAEKARNASVAGAVLMIAVGVVSELEAPRTTSPSTPAKAGCADRVSAARAATATPAPFISRLRPIFTSSRMRCSVIRSPFRAERFLIPVRHLPNSATTSAAET